MNDFTLFEKMFELRVKGDEEGFNQVLGNLSEIGQKKYEAFEMMQHIEEDFSHAREVNNNFEDRQRLEELKQQRYDDN